MRFAGSGAKLNLSGFQFSGRGGQGIAQAGGMATGAQSFRAVRSRAPKYGQIGRTSMAAEGAKKRSVMSAEASLTQTGMITQAKVKAAEMQAKAMKDAASKKSKGAMFGSALGAVGKLAPLMLNLCDERTKDCITEINNGLDIIRKLRPVSFQYKKSFAFEPWRKHYGFVAQEYENAMPDHIYSDEKGDLMMIDMNELIAVLVQSIQELESRLEELER